MNPQPTPLANPLEHLTRQQLEHVYFTHMGRTLRYPEDGNTARLSPAHLLIEDITTLTTKTKLILKPLDRVTEEDAKAFTTIKYPSAQDIHIIAYYTGLPMEFGFTARFLFYPNTQAQREWITWTDLSHRVAVYAISLGYDVPFYFAPDHPCNDMTAFQLGLAEYQAAPAHVVIEGQKQWFCLRCKKRMDRPTKTGHCPECYAIVATNVPPFTSKKDVKK